MYAAPEDTFKFNIKLYAAPSDAAPGKTFRYDLTSDCMQFIYVCSSWRKF
jgi:hypothetical protein